MSSCVLCGYSKDSCEAKLEGDQIVTFHEFPRQQNLREEWASFCGLTTAQLPTRAVLCSKHFAAQDFMNRALSRQPKKGTVPSLEGPETSPGPSRRGPPPPSPPPPASLPPLPMEMNISNAASTSLVEELLPEPYAAPNTLVLNGQPAAIAFDTDSRSNQGQDSAKDGQNILTKGLAENDLSTVLSSSITPVNDISEPFQYNLECCSTENFEQNNLSVDHTYCASDVRMPYGAERINATLGVMETLCVKTAENGSPRVYPGAAKAFCALGNYALCPEAAELCAAPSVCDSLCRMCGHHGTDLVSLHSTSTEADELSLLEKMQIHLGLETHSEDGMPQKICMKCEKALNSWQEAFVNFIVADTVLRKCCETKDHEFEKLSTCREEQSSYNRITSQCWEKASPVSSHLLKTTRRDTERKDATTNTEDTEEDEFDFIFSGNLWFNKEIQCICHMCKVIFRDKYELFEHCGECGKASYLCDQCGTDVGSREGVAVRFHQNSHMKGRDMKFFVDPSCRESKPYLCRLCKVIFKNRSELLEHRGQCEQTSYLCDTCGLVLARRRDAWNHRRKHIPILHPKSSDCECKTCRKRFYYKKNLTRHVSVHAQNVCEICLELFATPYLLQQHRLTHDSVLKFYCEPCCKMYVSAATLSTHQRQMHQNMPAIPFRDRVCSISRGVNGEENYSCKVCSAVFENMQSLITHLNEPKCLKCPQCSMTICNERNYFVHLARCKLQCRFCGQVLRSWETLRDHENRHTGHQPHKCKFCEKAFSTFAQRRNHQQKHVGPGYACDICGKTFFKRFLLHYHVLKHQGVKFECSVCKKLYASKKNLYKHTSRFHRKVTH